MPAAHCDRRPGRADTTAESSPGSSTIGGAHAFETQARTEFPHRPAGGAADHGSAWRSCRPHCSRNRPRNRRHHGILAARAGHVIAVELDRQFAAGLSGKFEPGRVTVVEQDVLQFDFAAAAVNGERLRVAGNLPYYITSPILLKLAASHAALDLAVLMVQREVADRVTAQPGSRDFGLLSATLQLYGPVEQLFTLPPSAFSPPPNVHSSVFRWRFAPRFAELGVEENGFFRFLRQAFAQKRKTLANNLRAAGIAPAVAVAALASAGIDQKTRAEALPIGSWHFSGRIWGQRNKRDPQFTGGVTCAAATAMRPTDPAPEPHVLHGCSTNCPHARNLSEGRSRQFSA